MSKPEDELYQEWQRKLALLTKESGRVGLGTISGEDRQLLEKLEVDAHCAEQRWLEAREALRE